MRQLSVLLLGLWAFLCASLFYWIGLVGEAFRFDASSLVYLRLGVGTWGGQAGLLLLAAIFPRDLMKKRLRLAGVYVGCAGLVFDIFLVGLGTSVSSILLAVPLGHGLGSVLLWRFTRNEV